MHTCLLDPHEIEDVGSDRVTSLRRTVTDLVLSLSRLEAVGVLDAVLREGRLAPVEFDGMRLVARGRRGVRRSSRWWELADGRAQSPLETRIRLLAVDAGLPPDELQVPVRDSRGVLLGFGDMAWHLPGGRVLVAEADGSGPHERPEALFRDRRRANDFLATGRVDMVRFTWADSLVPSYVVGVLRRHLGHHRLADLEQTGLRYGVS